jgi:hypothetical protein
MVLDGVAGRGLLAGMAGAVEIETVPVRNPGNSGEVSVEGAGGYGPDRICGAVDADDFEVFQACALGPGVRHAFDCGEVDFDEDGDVDRSDFSRFQRCYGGGGNPPVPGCSN